MRQDLIADAMKIIVNAEKTGKRECTISPSSALLKELFRIIKARGYIGEFEYIENKKGGIMKVKLEGKINDARAIKPRFPCKSTEIEKFEERYLPAKGFGLLVISTPKGLMTNDEAKKKEQGGVLLAYVY